MASEVKIKLGAVEATLTGDQLSLAGADLTAVPSELAQHAAGVKKLDFSWNSLSSVEHLEAFSEHLVSLVLDNNELTSDVQLPALPQLTTLWVNNNRIGDLERFLAHVRAQCPGLTYLSMLKNAACPNFFTGKPSEDYHRYRRTVLAYLPLLRFLDASPVSDAERPAAATAARSPVSSNNNKASRSAMGAVAIGSSPVDAMLLRDSSGGSASTLVDAPGDDLFEIAPEKGLDRMPARHQNDVHAAFGVSTYTYVGKASEGNRFISNNEL